jgi:hypothetical protein
VDSPETGDGGVGRAVPAGLDVTQPNQARVYDYLLGGKDNFEADRAAAEKVLRVAPVMAPAVRLNREFHQRAARWIARRGVTQFVDVGCGLPTGESTHQVVRQVQPRARVAYVDNDPVVVTHGQALLVRGSDQVAVMAGDIREPRTIVESLRGWPHADLDEPIGVLLTAVMHFIADDEDPWAMVALLMSALAPGSYLALSHGTADGLPPEMAAAGVAPLATEFGRPHLRGKDAVTAMFAGLEIVPAAEGGPAEVCRPGAWRPARGAKPDLLPGLWAGVGRKPS